MATKVTRRTSKEIQESEFLATKVELVQAKQAERRQPQQVRYGKKPRNTKTYNVALLSLGGLLEDYDQVCVSVNY